MKLRLLSLSVLALFVFSSCKDKLTGPPTPTPAASDTIAYWTFNNSIKDVSGHGHDLIAVSGGSFTTDRFGGALSAFQIANLFDLATDDNNSFQFTGSDSYSISAWIKTTSDSDMGILANVNQNNVNGGYQLGVKNGFAYALVSAAPYIVATGNTRVNDGQWHLITMVVAGSVGLSIYTDSIPGGNAVSSFMTPENGGAFEIGNAPSLAAHFNGIVDDILVRKHAMDPVEVAARFHEGGWSGGNAVSSLVWTNSTSGDFGTVQLNSSVAKQLHAFDNAGFPCTIQSVAITGSNASEFSVGALTLPATVHSQDSIDIPITWQPAGSTGSHTATLTVTYLGQSATQTLTLPLNGTLLATGFTQGNFGTSTNILSVCFPSSQVGYACGFNGVLLKSVDSGATWNALTSPTSENLYHISFASGNEHGLLGTNTGLVGGNNGTLLRTTDGGATWASINAPFQTVGGTLENIRDLKFLDDTHVMMVGGVGNVVNPPSQGFVMLSTDAGLTWNRTNTTSIGLYSIGSFDQNWQSVTVVGSTGEIFSTTDGGVTWSNQSVSNAGDDFLAVGFTSAHDDWAVTAYGTMYHAQSAGGGWGSPIQSGVSSSLRCVNISSPNEWWIAGDNGVILHTTNDGSNWSRADINGVSISWNDIVARDPHTLAFVGNNGTLYWYSH